MKKLDFKKELKDFYSGVSAKEFSIVDVPPLQFLMIDGQGYPGTSQEYQDAMMTLYPLSYEHENLQIKFGRIKDHYDSADWLFGRKLFERFGTILKEMGKPRILEDRTYEIYTKLSGKIHTSLSESADLITRYAKNPDSAIFPVHFYNEGKHSEAAFILNDVYGYIVRILAEFE